MGLPSAAPVAFRTLPPRAVPLLSSGRLAKAAPGDHLRQQVVAATVSLLVPWSVFTVNVALLSFTMHYRHSQLCWFVVELEAALVAVCAALAFFAVKNRRAGDTNRDPTWHLFVFASLAFAWSAGLSLGMTNYNTNMLGYYDITSLELYPLLDPSAASGAQLLDAGRIVFATDAYMSQALSYGVENGAMYCVTPITAGRAPLASYDFWAVGKDCCSAGQGAEVAFNCSIPRLGLPLAGMRLLDEGDTESFRLALKKLEMSRGIRADHPLFFVLTEDPIAELSQRQDRGLRFFIVSTLFHFAFQLFLVALVAVRLNASSLVK